VYRGRFARSPFQYILDRTPKPKPVTGSDEKSGIPVISLPFFKKIIRHSSFDFTKDKESFPALLKKRSSKSQHKGIS
jgi:hypothetical protein